MTRLAQLERAVADLRQKLDAETDPLRRSALDARLRSGCAALEVERIRAATPLDVYTAIALADEDRWRWLEEQMR